MYNLYTTIRFRDPCPGQVKDFESYQWLSLNTNKNNWKAKMENRHGESYRLSFFFREKKKKTKFVVFLNIDNFVSR